MTQFHQFGARSSFEGEIVTISSPGDNGLLKETLGTDGRGKVAVVDGGGWIDVALFGDHMAATAVENGWEGVVIFGAVRDVSELAKIAIGVKALGRIPRRGTSVRSGVRDAPISFGGVTFPPGAHLVSDDDGIVVLAAPGGA